MLRNYFNNSLKKYSDSDYLLNTRAKLLFIFINIAVVLLLVILFSMLLASFEDFMKTVVIIPPVIVGYLIALLFLRKGKYLTAANIVIGLGSLAVIAGLSREPFFKPEVAYSSYIFFVYPIMIICVIFSTIPFLTIISICFLATNIVLLFIMQNVINYQDKTQVMISFFDSFFSTVFVYFISILTIKIFQRSVEYANNQTEKSGKHLNFIEKLLNEVSEKIVIAMHQMSEKSKMV